MSDCCQKPNLTSLLPGDCIGTSRADINANFNKLLAYAECADNAACDLTTLVNANSASWNQGALDYSAGPTVYAKDYNDDSLTGGGEEAPGSGLSQIQIPLRWNLAASTTHVSVHASCLTNVGIANARDINQWWQIFISQVNTNTPNQTSVTTGDTRVLWTNGGANPTNVWSIGSAERKGSTLQTGASVTVPEGWYWMIVPSCEAGSKFYSGSEYVTDAAAAWQKAANDAGLRRVVSVLAI